MRAIEEEERDAVSSSQEGERSGFCGSALRAASTRYEWPWLLFIKPDHRGAKVSRRRPENSLFTHVANQLCLNVGGPLSSPEADNLLTWTPVP